MTKTALLTLLGILVAAPVMADGLTLLSTGRVAVLRANADPTKTKGFVRVGKDPGLANAPSPLCPTVTRFELSALVGDRVGARQSAPLDCTKWRAKGPGFVYEDDDATHGVRRITYGRNGLAIDLRGPGFTLPGVPVGYLQTWFEVGTTRFHVRVHAFRKNSATLIVARRPSSATVAGEVAFWDVLWADDKSESRQDEALTLLGKALKRSKKDGRAAFLKAMMHLYRFGIRVVSFNDVSPEAIAELTAADTTFDQAVPLLWNRDTGVGDSRVPGFAAAAKFTLGYLTNDAALRDRGLADLRYAIDINGFFNVFDLIPVLQAIPPSDPLFMEAFDEVNLYLNDPATLGCAGGQPEICNNRGLAPRNLSGSLVLFGDVQAKGGRATGTPEFFGAAEWYELANAASSGWVFADALAIRHGHAEARTALYLDDDVTNDPAVIGAGPEACASCHNR